MIAPVTIMLLGRPVPGNERRRTASGHRFLPKRQADALAALRVAASEAMEGQAMLEGALRLSLLAEMPVPASWSNKKRGLAIVGEVLPIGKPDLKNLLWLAEDALSSVVFADDALVCEHRARKVYGVQPKLVITVEALTPGTD